MIVYTFIYLFYTHHPDNYYFIISIILSCHVELNRCCKMWFIIHSPCYLYKFYGIRVLGVPRNRHLTIRESLLLKLNIQEKYVLMYETRYICHTLTINDIAIYIFAFRIAVIQMVLDLLQIFLTDNDMNGWIVS
jgi:hypothetical protein